MVKLCVFSSSSMDYILCANVHFVHVFIYCVIIFIKFHACQHGVMLIIAYNRSLIKESNFIVPSYMTYNNVYNILYNIAFIYNIYNI